MSLNSQINKLRQEMIETAEKHAMDLLHPEVIKYSQMLDLLIVKAMTKRNRAA